jgi:L-arabinose isomerase
VYNACNPLTPYNIESLVTVREAFLKADVPKDFSTFQDAYQREYEHEDHGAQRENVLSEAGLRALGLEKFDENAEGLTEGQRAVRRLANERLGLA